MGDSNSVLTRIPVEVWRIILLEVMHIPYILDITCKGSLFKLWDAIDSSEAHWDQSEWQRKLLCRVCKSWKHFAETTAYRSIGFQDYLEEPHILAHARRALLYKSLEYMFTIPTLWEVVEISSSGLVDKFLFSIVQGYHPRLRRLSMRANLSSVLATCQSATFGQLTFLHLQFYTWPPHALTGIQTTLPRLEVLIWEDPKMRLTPSDIFRLPNLHHFGWSIKYHYDISSTLLSFARTLRSLSIRSPNRHWCIEMLLLPDLNEFPHLEEFSINTAFGFKDPKPFPPTYPLHTVYLRDFHSFTVLVPCVMHILDCNPAKLRRIQFRNLEWGNGGVPENAGNREERATIVQLADWCEERGIRVESSKGQVRSEMPLGHRDFTF